MGPPMASSVHPMGVDREVDILGAPTPFTYLTSNTPPRTEARDAYAVRLGLLPAVRLGLLPGDLRS